MTNSPLLFLKRLLAEGYYHLTSPARQWYGRRLAAMGRAPLAVLAFHRIADDNATGWTTPTACFVEAIHWLRDHFELISLAELQARIRSGHNRSPGVSITFDDGYADNCHVALPLLIEERIPCTYFVTTNAVLEGKPFAHDVRRGTPLAPNTVEQLRELSRVGIEIGMHSRTHADLGPLTDPHWLTDELVTSRDELAAAVGQRIRYFAFPFGFPENLSAAAFHLARSAGYEGVCSAYGRWNYPGDDAFHIHRRCVDGAPNRSKNWALIDPLRERFLSRFTPPPLPTPASSPILR